MTGARPSPETDLEHKVSRSVLMIVYYYPPLGGIGSQRTLKLAKYLTRIGWEPTVLTVGVNTIATVPCDESAGALDGVRVLRSRNPDLVFRFKRLLGFDTSQRVAVRLAADDASGGRLARLKKRAAKWALGWLGIPDRVVDWYPWAAREADRICRELKPSVIYSSSPPETCHLVAAHAADKAGIPWVADFRDPWIRSYDYGRSGAARRLNRLICRRTTSRADRVVAVSDAFLRQVASDCPEARTGPVIPNGFDREDFDSVEPVASEGFNIFYAGNMYYPDQDPSPFFEAIGLLRDRGVPVSPLKFQYAGPSSRLVEELADRFGVKQHVTTLDQIPYAESIARQKGACALLFVQWRAGTENVLTGKLLEYLGAQRPILACVPEPGPVDSLLSETLAGAAGRDPEELAGILEAWLTEFRESGALSYHGRADEVERYSHVNMAASFSRLFNELTQAGHSEPG